MYWFVNACLFWRRHYRWWKALQRLHIGLLHKWILWLITLLHLERNMSHIQCSTTSSNLFEGLWLHQGYLGSLLVGTAASFSPVADGPHSYRHSHWCQLFGCESGWYWWTVCQRVSLVIAIGVIHSLQTERQLMLSDPWYISWTL